MKRIIHTSGLDNFNSVLDQRLNDIVVSQNLPIAMYEAWPVEIGVMQDPLPGWAYFYRDTKAWEALYLDDNFAALARFQMGGLVYARVAAESEDRCKSFIESLKGTIRQVKSQEGAINLKFWTNGQRGPQHVTRQIDAPVWSDISENYHSETKDKMSHLVEKFVPAHGGQLILWHGPPGTGKTYALRSLVREWSKWCSAEYVVDPEVFFGASPAYMMQVLLDSDWYPELLDEEEEQQQQRWRLLIFEDTGELLSRDAGVRSGQGLSRLLNIVDGLIGQGLKVLILITTNEELGSLHEAVSRPGRAALKAHFGPLGAVEAASWAQKHGLVLPTVRPYTLAELYAMSEGFTESKHEVNRVGFSPLTNAHA